MTAAPHPLTLAVIRHKLQAVAEEMVETMTQTCFSPILNQNQDFSAVVLDAAGQTLAQAERVPIHMGAMPWAIRAMAEAFAGDIAKADVLMANDPYWGGSHLPGITPALPGFAEGARRLWVADVYGSDPAGGNALAIVRALGWLASSGCKVVTISLVGPRNIVLERAIAQAQRRGIVIVAAVGNDGPAAPPAYPASYAKVVAVTGVDRKGRALIEAGRALHIDYAAPGADVHALNAKGKPVRLRGTSFATPLVAARLAGALASGGDWQGRLDREARDLGPRGPDKLFGRGLLCEGCAAKP
ncbi:MAG: hydantoinase B/oxoprolinase family protein [Blastomonas sp.]|nr:hydantoinase B/oxoprolinase family protein [Blastomonas sp.]